MSMMPGIAPPHPIPIKDRASILFIEKGRLDVLDGAFVVVDKNGVRTHIPVGGIACLMLEPGTPRVPRRSRIGRTGGVPARVGWRGRRPPVLGWPTRRCTRRPLAPPGALGSGPGCTAQGRSQDVRHAIRRTRAATTLGRSVARYRRRTGEAPLPGTRPAAWRDLETAEVRPRELAGRRSTESLSQPGDRVPLRAGRSRHSGCGLRTSRRLSTYGQASVLRLRRGGHLQV